MSASAPTVFVDDDDDVGRAYRANARLWTSCPALFNKCTVRKSEVQVRERSLVGQSRDSTDGISG